MADGTTVTGGMTPDRAPDRAPVAAPRSRGRLSVAVTADGAGGTRLDRLHQGGCLRLLFPDTGCDAVTAIALNTGGGLTGGDRLTFAAAATGGRLVLSTQAAERVYRAQPGSQATVATRIDIGAGARVDWLPQETILFDRSALVRTLEVEMAADATFLIVEPLILGRRAMGECLDEVHLRDRVIVRRGGRPVFADALRLDADAEAWRAGPAGLDGGVALAAVLMVSPQAEGHLAPVRALLEGAQGVRGGVSMPAPGVLFARLVGQDGFDLRRVLIPLLTALGQRALPRTWML